jgi:hypothetical protein
MEMEKVQRLNLLHLRWIDLPQQAVLISIAESVHSMEMEKDQQLNLLHLRWMDLS